MPMLSWDFECGREEGEVAIKSGELVWRPAEASKLLLNYPNIYQHMGPCRDMSQMVQTLQLSDVADFLGFRKRCSLWKKQK